jgi:hypothetical protein
MRLNTVMGVQNCFPSGVIRAVLADRALQAPHENNMHSPIHIEDMKHQLEPLLQAASNPALIVNWGGDEAVSMQEWVRLTNEWSGRTATLEVRTVPGAPIANAADPALRRSITGPSRINFREEFRKLYDATVATGVQANLDMSGMSIRK